MPSARRIIFTCGVRFMRAKSAGVSGRLSGSLAAAASICCCVIGRMALGVLCEVVILLTLCCASRRDQSDTAIPLRVDNGQHNTFGHPDQDETVFAIIFAVVEPFDGKRITKNGASRFELDAVLSVVFGTVYP